MKYATQDLQLTDFLTLHGDVVAELWVGELKDDRGNVYRDGAYKVKITPAGRKHGCPAKTKTFKGETAHTNADRLWYDIGFWVRREEW